MYNNCGAMFQVIGQLFAAVDGQCFERFKNLYTAATNLGGAANLCVSEWQVFLTMILVHQLRVDPHKDDGDMEQGWVAMFVTGEFTGGDLVLPSLGIKMDYQPGDIVFMRSGELEHYVDEWEGTRTGVVMFNKTTTASKVCTELGLQEDAFRPKGEARKPRVKPTIVTQQDREDMGVVDEAV